MSGDFVRYLRAKRTVDDRALDRRLASLVGERLTRAAEDRDGRPSVLDAGGGVGTMLTRALEWDLLPPGRIQYTLVDTDPDAVAAVEPTIRGWANGRPFSVTGDGSLTVEGESRRITVHPVVADAADLAAHTSAEYDLVVGVALLDIVPLDDVTRLLEALRPGGSFYFPVVFDGETTFRPAHPADRVVADRYHEHMDWKPGGNHRAGAAVLDYLGRLDGVRLDGVAGSDWVVRPREDGSEYPGDEAFFLRYILDTVESAVRELPGSTPPVLDQWLAARRNAVDAGDLVYLTHQLDFLGRVSGGTEDGRDADGEAVTGG